MVPFLRVGDGDDGDGGRGDAFFGEVAGDAAGEGHPWVGVEEPWAGEFGGHVQW